MNRFFKYITVALLLFSANLAYAQSLSSLFSSSNVSDVVATVTGGSSITVDNVAGEWSYVAPAVELSGEDILSSAAGIVATAQIEAKLTEICEQAGIKEGGFTFTFAEDLTFSTEVEGRELSGNYSIDSENSQIILNFNAYNSISLGTLTANATLVSSSLSLLFSADKLLDIISTIGSLSSDSNVQLLTTLAEQYNGVMLGFELAKEQSTIDGASSAVEAASSLLNKLF
ncbi:MAG: DUF4923 family protein [Rikenellaceae bacterium]